MQKLLLITIAASALAACNASTSASDAPSVGIIRPLATGNFWIYDQTGKDLAGNELSGFAYREDIGNSMHFKGTTYFEDSIESTGEPSMITYNAETDSGLYILRQNNFTGGDPGFFRLAVAKYPCSVGDTFGTIARNGIGANGSFPGYHYWKVVSLNTTITVPAGTFTCVVYQEHQTDSSRVEVADPYYMHTDYYAPHVGLVKSYGDRYVPESYLLASYKVK